ncbi:Protein orai-2 [Platysternon megacephalum]|uniref:Protein orai-2 n=1 Tax=Platysternon megacephalum TaxID=55544 RepID=A0A4D9DPH2_9SAUR|nr:Protein orai-2 [Platysternon megacephalum]
MGVLKLTPSAAESLISSPSCLSAPQWADRSGGVLGEHSPWGVQSATECMFLTAPALRGLDSGSPIPGDLQRRDGEAHLQPLPIQAAASRVLPPLGLEWETHLPGGWAPVASAVSLLLSLPTSNWLSVLPDPLPLSSAEPRSPSQLWACEG